MRLILLLALFFPLLSQAAAPTGTNNIPVLRPPHAEIPPTFWEQYGAWIIVLGCFAALLAAVFAWLVTRPQPPIVIPPEEEARRALAVLPAGATDGATLSRISQILRHYVRRAFDLPANESTTAEFCQTLSNHPQIGAGLALALGEFFRDGDLHKFSPAPPQPAAVTPVTQALALIAQCETRRASLRTGGTATPATPSERPA